MVTPKLVGVAPVKETTKGLKDPEMETKSRHISPNPLRNVVISGKHEMGKGSKRSNGLS